MPQSTRLPSCESDPRVYGTRGHQSHTELILVTATVDDVPLVSYSCVVNPFCVVFASDVPRIH